MSWLKSMFARRGKLEGGEYSEDYESSDYEDSSDMDSGGDIQVIRYIFKKDGTPEMAGVCQWHSPLLPDIGSIIWAPDGGAVRPYMVKRIDYMEDSDGEVGHGILIVVRSASRDDVARGLY